MSDIEKKADALLAEEIKKSQSRMDKFEADKEKTNEEILKTSEWKNAQDARWTELDENIKKLDESIKSVKAPPMSEKEEKAQDYEKFNDSLRYAGMVNAKGIRFDKNELKSHEPFESEEKMMQTNVDVRAGYLTLPPEYIKEVLDQLAHEFSPVRGVARNFRISSNRLQLPSKTARGVFSWVAEAGAIAEDATLTFGLEDIPTHDGMATASVSYQMLRDSAFDLAGYLKQEYMEAWSVGEGTAFVNGTGIGEPEGLMVNADIDHVHSLNAASIPADAYLTTLFTLKEKYANNASWLMRRATLGTAAVLKGGDGQYLAIRFPDRPQFMIAGLPVLQSPDMPAVAALAYPVLLGDFRKGYAVVDQIGSGISITDPFTNKLTGQIDYLWGFSVGGQTIIPEAFRKILVSL